MNKFLFLFITFFVATICQFTNAQAPEYRTITLGMYSYYPDHNYGEYLKEIKDTGANSVNLTFPLLQENGRSTSMRLVDTRSPSNMTIRRTIRQAQRERLDVVLMPIVLLQNPEEDDWRGNMEPVPLSDWFRNYRKHILEYATMAEEEKIEWLVIGSELSSLEKYGDEWIKLIEEVRAIYSGKLMYSCNWDHFHGPEKWWEKLDAIGLSSYYELTGDDNATQQELNDGWKYWKDFIIEWHDKHGKNLPLYFTEVGYPSMDGGAVFPWDYTLDKPKDWEEQAMAYKAFINSWDGDHRVIGVTFYKWESFEEDNSLTYSPKGKPAEKIIRDWFATDPVKFNPIIKTPEQKTQFGPNIDEVPENLLYQTNE